MSDSSSSTERPSRDLGAIHRDDEGFFRTLVEQLPDGVFVISDGNFAYVNDALCCMLGYSDSELIGRPIAGLIAPEDRDMVLTRYRGRLSGEKLPARYPFRLLHKDGVQRVTVLMSVGVMPRGDGSLVTIGTVRDVGEQLRLLAELQRSEAELRTIVDSLPDMYYRTDANGVLTIASPSCERYLGYSPEEMLGRNLADFYVDPSDREEVLRQIQGNDGTPTLVDSALRHKQGHTVWVRTRALFLRDKEGNVIGVEGLARENSEQRSAEERLRYLADHDALTQVFNRACFERQMREALLRAGRGGGKVALLFLDLNDFKDVNDRLGHAAGDQLLIEVARRLTRAVRETDHVARIGGDEFTVTLEGEVDLESAQLVARKVLQTVEQPIHLQRGTCTVSASLGIAVYPEHGTDLEALLQAADHAMYSAKRADGGGYGSPATAEEWSD